MKLCNVDSTSAVETTNAASCASNCQYYIHLPSVQPTHCGLQPKKNYWTTLCPRKNCTLHCHNSGKQRRISTKFYANTESLNCKQVIKFQQNRSTSATATASLVRPLKSISVHYKHRRDWLSSVHPCKWQDVSTTKVCVQMCTVCLDASLKTWTPLPDRFIDDHLVEIFPLFDQARLQLVDVTWLRYTRSCSFYQIW